MTLEAVNALRSLVDMAVNFLDSWTIPHTTMTPWDLMVYILIFNVILWLLRHIFNWEIGNYMREYSRSSNAGGSNRGAARNAFRKVNRGK